MHYWISSSLYNSVVLTALISVAAWMQMGLYRAVIRFIDSKAFNSILIGCALSSITLVLVTFLLDAELPRSVPLIYFAVLVMFVAGSRFLIRYLINRENEKYKQPVIIYGAGSSGRQLLYSLEHGAEYKPVAFVDDNKDLHNSSVANIRVYPSEALVDLIIRYDVSKVLLAIPSCSGARKSVIVSIVEELNVDILTIPGTADLVSGKCRISELRRVEIEDLLGRSSVLPNKQLLSKNATDKNILVTGAGGSIGSELCRQLLLLKPSKLILFDSSEYSLYSIEKELNKLIEEESIGTIVSPILASVTDRVVVERVITSFEINTIYHAAAYKHVPIVEHNVISGINNNVWGTMVCAESAYNLNVENFVLVSTDKAVRPTNVMGATKRLAELVLQALHNNQLNSSSETSRKKTNFSMVRFGNVLGSSGSVVPLFEKQIAEGGPITITHPDITRYFMTIPEAAQLVIQAGAMGTGGEVYVLDMGKPVKINDLAENMVHLSGLTIRSDANPDGDIEIVYTGLRPGEKLYEELLIGGDVEGTEHERIMKAKEISMKWDDLQKLLRELGDNMANQDIRQLRKLLKDAPLGYDPQSEIADCVWLSRDEKLGASTSNANVHSLHHV